MRDFALHRPDAVEAAKALLAAHPEAKLMAGGMTLLPTMKQRLAAPTDLISLSGMSALNAISAEGDAIVIGAMTTHDTVARSALVQEKIPALAGLAGDIGDPQVRNRGTIGGSIANNDPAADYPAALLALGATIQTESRTIPADEFFVGLFETALEDDEIITSVSVPVPQAATYLKFKSPASRYALVGVCVARTDGGVRVAVTGAGPGVFRMTAFEDALGASFDPAALEPFTVPTDDLLSDIHGSAAYRGHLIKTMTRRAVAQIA